MGLLQPIGDGQSHLKAGFLGFAGAGKTHTAMLLALGVRKFFDLKGPIAMYDTEKGVDYIGPRVFRETGQKIVGVQSRSLDDLIAFTNECVKAGVSVAIADSMTHPWREVCRSALQEINARRKQKGQYPLKKLEFQHWGPIKDRWEVFTSLFLNSPLHMIVCGRAGYEYDFEQTDEDNHQKKELVKTGIKMKTEGEFGFEPGLVVEMSIEQNLDAQAKNRIINQATVLKCRFDVINGYTCDRPTFDFFKPHVQLLDPSIYAPLDTEAKTKLGLDEDGSDEARNEMRSREILAEEVKGLFTLYLPGQSAEEKKRKAQFLQQHFGSTSWTAVERMHSDKLKAGFESLKAALEAEVKTEAASQARIAEAIARKAPREEIDAIALDGVKR